MLRLNPLVLLVPLGCQFLSVATLAQDPVPLFDAANRVNAYGTYLLMERELLSK